MCLNNTWSNSTCSTLLMLTCMYSNERRKPLILLASAFNLDSSSGVLARGLKVSPSCRVRDTWRTSSFRMPSSKSFFGSTYVRSKEEKREGRRGARNGREGRTGRKGTMSGRSGWREKEREGVKRVVVDYCFAHPSYCTCPNKYTAHCSFKT